MLSKVISVIGDKQLGKTTQVRELVYYIMKRSEKNDCVCVYIDCRSYFSVA